MGKANLQTGDYNMEKFLDDNVRCHVLLQNIDDGIVIVQDNVIKYVNKILGELLLSKTADLIGNKFSHYFVEPYSRSIEWPPIGESLAKLMRSDKATIQIKLKVTMIKSERKSVKLIVLTNIDELQHFKQESQKLYDELEMRVKERTEQLEQSHERFRNLVELLPEIVFECNAEGYLNYANRQGLETFQLNREDFERGLHLIEILTEESYEYAMESIQRIYGGQVDQGEYMVRRKDGTQFPVFVRANKIENEGKIDGIRGIVIDLTESRKAEKEKKDSKIN
jgi:PAS domain S-box-containing protein